MRVIQEKDLELDDIKKSLQEGKVIVYPTETCYGLGCDALNTEAVERIFSIKRRQEDKTLIIIVSGVDMIRDYVLWDDTLQELADKYWPGALTMVVRAKPNVSLPRGVLRDDHTIAFRVTSHPLASALSQMIMGPLVSTSANISLGDNPYGISSVLKSFEGEEYQPDIVIDGGSLSHRLPSTIVRIIDGKVEVVRQGEVIVI